MKNKETLIDIFWNELNLKKRDELIKKWRGKK